MRSIATDERSPVAIIMPGRYKSCRRSPSELFTKEQEQELQQCAAEGEDCRKAEQDAAEAKEKASPPHPIEVNPPKLTPLRWRSTSMKALNGSHDMASSAQQTAAAEESSKIQPLSAQISETMRASQMTKRPSQAQLRAQVMNSLSSQSVERANVRLAREPVNLPSEPQHSTGKDGSLNSAKPVELQDTIAKTEPLPEKKQEEKKFSSMAQEEPVKEPEKREIASGNGTKGAAKPVKEPEKGEIASGNGIKGAAKPVKEPEKGEIASGNGIKGAATPVKESEKGEIASGNGIKGAATPVKESEKGEIASGNGTKGAAKKADMPIVPINHDLPEEIVFQPVDLDQRYREKELVRHVTAAKIQNREEALLNNPGSPATNGRKGPVGEEPATMTIEFLRARLQAERTASKTVKLKMESLSKKVADLESKLLAEVELRKTAEAALHDALSKLKQAAPQVPLVPTTSGGLKVADAEGKDNVKTVQWSDVGSKAEIVSGSNKTVSRDELPSAANLSLKEKKEPEGSKDAIKDGAAAVDGEVVNKGGLWRDRSVSPHPSSGSVPGVGVNGEKESVAKVSQDSSSDSGTERAGSPPNQPKQDKRAVIEERLRSMWAKIGEDMAALAEVRGDGEPGSKDAVGWMGQLPSVLQEKQQSSGDSGGPAGGAANGQQVDSSEGDSEHTEAGSANGKKKQNLVHNEADAFAEKRKSNSFKRNSSLAKNVAKLVEQYEFQETAQREWEENFEAQQSHEQNEGEPPALVTQDGAVVTESIRAKEGLTRSQSEEGKKPVHPESVSRSKSLGFLPSQQGIPAGGKKSRRGTSNGRIEILDENLIVEESLGIDDTEELLFDPETEVAEELPNGIYIHHSRAEVDPTYNKRGSSKDAAFMYRRGGTERVGVSNDIHSPRRHRFPRADSHGDAMDHKQGWPVREVQDRASRDMYYDPVINDRGGVSYNPEQFHHRSKSIPERIPDDMYRNGPWREDRRAPPTHYSNPSTEEAPGMPYGYTHRDHPDQDVPSYRAAPTYRQSSDGHRSVPGAWQEGGGRGMNHPPYGYPSKGYGVEEPQQTPYIQQGMYDDTGAGYRGKDMQYRPHGTHNVRSDYYSSGGVSGPGPSYVPPDRPPASQGYTVHEDGTAPVGVADEGSAAPGEAGEVLKALRIAKQQIKSATGEQAAFMTAQYTVSQEHRYSAGGAQVSKTSYTVEAPVGWHLEGGKSSSKRNGTNGLNMTELISGGGPLNAAGGESSYVEKLNVGRGIQFFFSG